MSKTSGPEFDNVFATRIAEADEFYAACRNAPLTPEERAVVRQADAGLLWSRQFYHYIVEHWLEGDPAQPPPPAARADGRNRGWSHLWARDIIAMPDTWEYPWFACSEDTAFPLRGDGAHRSLVCQAANSSALP